MPLAQHLLTAVLPEPLPTQDLPVRASQKFAFSFQA